MANYYELSLDDILTRFSGNTEYVYRFDLYVTDGSTTIAGLTASDFSLGGVPTFVFDTVGATGYYTFTVANFEPTLGSYQYAQVVNGSSLSDKMLIDFMEGYSSSVATYSFVLPTQTGEYKIRLDEVNNQDFSTVQSSQLRGAEEITTTDSMVQVYKSYLTHFAGETLSLKVTIANGDSATLEVSMKADKQ